MRGEQGIRFSKQSMMFRLLDATSARVGDLPISFVIHVASCMHWLMGSGPRMSANGKVCAMHVF